jgi:hypothetical protein
MKNLIDKRIQLIEMVDDPNPVEPGTLGTIYHVGGGVLNVKWDNGRNLGVIEHKDKYKILC